jgi:pteridine reductase
VKLEGTRALITGGARRVGRAIALELARCGCDVAVHYRSSVTEAEELRAEIAALGCKVITVAGDLNDPPSWPVIIDRTVDALGGLDILVNNASVFPTDRPDTVEAFDRGMWEEILRVNLVASVGLIHHAVAHLRENRRGRIVNLCDISGERPWPDHLAYCVSKAGLAAVTKALARALAPEVCVYGVAPGIAVFPEHYSGELRRSLVRPVPLGREGSPEEIAGFVRALLECGDYVTGEVIKIDGGRNLQ